MKVFVFLCLLGAAVAQLPVQKSCQGGAVTGPCKAFVVRYYYDTRVKKCMQFTYGGCEGSGNQYETEEECLRNCHTSTDTERKSCIGGPVTGPCKANIVNYYFDERTRTCRQFVYGGCQGSGNRYDTEAECLRSCGGSIVTETKTCTGGPEPGTCKANIISYYYDERTGTCKQFVYGGCGGNGNQYETEQECLRKCRGSIVPERKTCTGGPEPGTCKANVVSFYYDEISRTCKQFVYGGCGGNGNRYDTKQECERTCGGGISRPDAICNLPPEEGPCRAYISRYFYNAVTRRCEEFFYGGCEGNANNFRTKSECESTCRSTGILSLSRADSNICDLDPERGMCLAYMPRYYYDRKTGTCKEFIYGGCGGNDNNFKSAVACRQACLA